MTETKTPAYNALKKKNPKHARFVDEYRVDRNAAQAAVRAGYGKAGSRTRGSEFLRLPKYAAIQAAIAEADALSAATLARTIEQIDADLDVIATANMLDYLTVGDNGQPYLDFSKLTREQASAIQELTVETSPGTQDEDGNQVRPETRKTKFKLYDKLRAKDMQLRIRGGYAPDKHEHAGKDGGPIETKDMTEYTPTEIARRIAFALVAGQPKESR